MTCPACGRDLYARGYCAMHYKRLLRHGEIDIPEGNRQPKRVERLSNNPVVKQIIRRREEVGISRNRLAIIAGVSSSTIMHMEHGKSETTLANLEATIGALGGRIPEIRWGEWKK